MSNNRDAKRAELKDRLLAAAEALIAQKGLAGLKAREVTAEAGCALGALYNAYQDLDMLVVHVNSRTLERLGEALRAADPGAEGSSEARLQALASAYLTFAQEHRRLWSALFQHRPPDEETEWPDWHLRNHAVLIELIVPPLSRLLPDLPPAALSLRARTFFAAVHGVVMMAMNRSVVGLPRDALAGEVAALVTAISTPQAGRG